MDARARASAVNAPWPRPSVAGLATMVFWIAGILFAAGGLRLIVTRLRLATPAAAPPQRGAAD